MNENIQAWVNALESGVFRQTKEGMKDGNSYDVLGVACYLYEKETGKTLPTDEDGNYLRACLVREYYPVRKWLKLVSPTGRYAKKTEPRKACYHLTADNDSGVNFYSLAKIIRQNYRSLCYE